MKKSLMMQQVVLTHNYLTDIPLALARLPNLHTLLVSPSARERSIAQPACMVACVCARVDEETETGYVRMQLEHNAIEQISGEEPRDPGPQLWNPGLLNPIVVQLRQETSVYVSVSVSVSVSMSKSCADAAPEANESVSVSALGLCLCLCLHTCAYACVCENNVQTP